MKGGISATHGAVTQGEGGNYLPVDNDMRTYSFRNGDVKYTIAGNGYPIVMLKKNNGKISRVKMKIDYKKLKN